MNKTEEPDAYQVIRLVLLSESDGGDTDFDEHDESGGDAVNVFSHFYGEVVDVSLYGWVAKLACTINNWRRQ